MTLDEEEQAVYRRTVNAVHEVNEGLKQMRKLRIACTLHESDGLFYLDAKAILGKSHHQP